MTIRWITPSLGTAPAAEMRQQPTDVHIVDVRDLVDKAGNRADAVREKIAAGQKLLSENHKVVVCCDYGISRSSAIAAGILALAEGITLESAVRRVQDATGEAEIKLEPLQVVRVALGGQAELRQRSAGHSVLVTGGTGFLGKATVEALARDMHVVAPPRAKLDVSIGSTQLDLLACESDVQTIVHLANPRVYTSNVAMGASITMLRNVIDVCLARNARLIYLSGWEIFSGYHGTLSADESLPALPHGPYAETKFLCEALIGHCIRHLGLRCALIRSSPVYGPGSDRPKFIYNFLDKARRNETIVTHRYRNGEPALDLLHRDDLVSLIARVTHSVFTGTVHAGTGVVTSTCEIAKMLAALVGSASQVEQVTIEAYTARIAMDCSLAYRTFEWSPAVTFTDGLATLVATESTRREAQRHEN